MNRYRVWQTGADARAEYIFAETAFEARTSYARKNRVSIVDVMSRLERR